MTGQIANPAIGIIGMLLYPIIVYLAIKSLRTAQGEHISFGKALGVGTLACAIAGLMSGLFQYVYLNFIDPAAIDEIVNASLEMMESFGTPEDVMEEAAESTRNGYTLVRSTASGLGMGAFLGLIVSLIAGAIMKKEAPINV